MSNAKATISVSCSASKRQWARKDSNLRRQSHQIYSLPRRLAQGISVNEVVSTEISSGNSRYSANLQGTGKSRRGSRQSANLFDELIVDNFAGGGGASMGIEAACGRSVDNSGCAAVVQTVRQGFGCGLRGCIGA